VRAVSLDIEAQITAQDGNITHDETAAALKSNTLEEEGPKAMASDVEPLDVGEQVETTVQREYEEEWMKVAVALALGQLLAFTVLLFVNVTLHVNILVWIILNCMIIFISQLSACFVFILFALQTEKYRLRRLWYWLVAGFIFVAYSFTSSLPFFGGTVGGALGAFFPLVIFVGLLLLLPLGTSIVIQFKEKEIKA